MTRQAWRSSLSLWLRFRCSPRSFPLSESPESTPLGRSERNSQRGQLCLDNCAPFIAPYRDEREPTLSTDVSFPTGESASTVLIPTEGRGERPKRRNLH